MKKEYTAFYELIGLNKGTWMLILVHVVILISLITVFSSIIEKMQGY
jgi:uncharacterized membrane protein YccC